MSKEYDELKEDISALRAEVVKLNSKMIYNYVDNNMPDWARPTIQKMMDKGFLKGDENGCLGLTDELLRVFVTNDRAGVYDLAPQRSADDSAESAFDASQKC